MSTKPNQDLAKSPAADKAGEQQQDPKSRPADRKQPGCLTGCLMITTLIVIGFAGLAWAAYRSAQKVPDYYAEVLETKPEQSAIDGDNFEIHVADFQNTARAKNVSWRFEFSQNEVNGWIASDLPNKFPTALPENISDPRVMFSERDLKLAFKYHSNRFSGIVVVHGDLFCTANPNEIAVQIKNVQSGFLSLPIGPWMDRLSEGMEQAGFPVLWSEKDGHPVALITVPERYIDFGSDRVVLIEAIEVSAGCMTIAGSTLDRKKYLEQGTVALEPVDPGHVPERNLLRHSQQLDQIWRHARTNVDPDVVVAPDGKSTADRISKQGLNANDRIYQVVPCLPGQTYTASAYLKNVNVPGATSLTFRTGKEIAGRILVEWDGDSIKDLSAQGDGAQQVAASSLGDGWWRVSFSAQATASRGRIELDIDRETADVPSALYAWGIQLEPGSLTDYERTTVRAYQPEIPAGGSH